MKCNSCGLISCTGKSECYFCETVADSTSDINLINNDLKNKTNSPLSFITNTIDLIAEISSTPASDRNFMAFIFPIAYLWGYGAKDSARKIAAIMLLPAISVSVRSHLLHFRLANFLSLTIIAWVLYVTHLVSTRTPVLVDQNRPYNLGESIFIQLVFSVIYWIVIVI